MTMNRVDFMQQLESLLQNVAATEREEAIQYYNDYFDDAGAENEQNVIEALGNPARVAENIKRDLIGNGYGEPQSQKAKASDRALMKYGDGDTDGSKESVGNSAGAGIKESAGHNAGAVTGESIESKADTDIVEGTGFHTGSGTGEGRNVNNSGSTGSFRDWETPPRYHEAAREPEPNDEGMPVWAMALLITVLVLASPVIFGLAITVISVVFTFFVVWCSFVFAFGAVAVAFLLLLVVLVVVGLICCFTDPWVGMALTGGGLICGAVGLVFLMLTVGMAGVVTPAICRGISALFRIFRKRSVKRHARRAF